MSHTIAYALIRTFAIAADYAWRAISLMLGLFSACGIVATLFFVIATGEWRLLPLTAVLIALNIWSQKAFDDSFDGEVADAVEDLGNCLLRRRSAA